MPLSSLENAIKRGKKRSDAYKEKSQEKVTRPIITSGFYHYNEFPDALFYPNHSKHEQQTNVITPTPRTQMTC